MPLTLHSCQSQLFAIKVCEIRVAVKGRQHDGARIVKLGQQLIIGLQVNKDKKCENSHVQQSGYTWLASCCTSGMEACSDLARARWPSPALHGPQVP
jgi:hypothetical protein